MYSPDWYFDPKQNIIATAFKLLWQSQGIYLSLIRTGEPFFFKVIGENIVKVVLLVFCCRKQVEERIESKSLDRDLFDDDELEQLADEYNQIRKTMSQMNAGFNREFNIYSTQSVNDDVGLGDESFEGLDRAMDTEKQSRRNSSLTTLRKSEEDYSLR